MADQEPPRNQLVEEIEREHAFLSTELGRLRELLACGQDVAHCNSCNAQKQDSCQNGIDGFLMEFLIFMRQHFAHEDKSMRKENSPADVHDAFESHITAHADMMENLTVAIRSPTVRHQGEKLVALIEHWLDDHIRTHDLFLLDWLRQQAAKA